MIRCEIPNKRFAIRFEVSGTSRGFVNKIGKISLDGTKLLERVAELFSHLLSLRLPQEIGREIGSHRYCPATALGISKGREQLGNRATIGSASVGQRLEEQRRRESSRAFREAFEHLFSAVEAHLSGQQLAVGGTELSNGAPGSRQDPGLRQR
jgi:hypothetical protein